MQNVRQLKRSVGICLMVGLLGLSKMLQANVNLVDNGSFESGSFNGWKVTGTGTSPGIGPAVIRSATQYGDVIPSDPFTFGPNVGGIYQAYLVDDNALETLSQTLSLQAGKQYELGFDLFPTLTGAANVNPYSLTGSLGNHLVTTADSGLHAITAGKWTHFSGTYTPSLSGPVDFNFVFTAGATPAKDVLVDEVYVVQGTVTTTPEPALFGVLGFFLVGVSFLARKSPEINGKR